MSNVIAFTRPEPRDPSLKSIDGATLFMHIRKTTLIVHLANPHPQPLSAGTSSGNA